MSQAALITFSDKSCLFHIIRYFLSVHFDFCLVYSCAFFGAEDHFDICRALFKDRYFAGFAVNRGNFRLCRYIGCRFIYKFILIRDEGRCIQRISDFQISYLLRNFYKSRCLRIKKIISADNVLNDARIFILFILVAANQGYVYCIFCTGLFLKFCQTILDFFSFIRIK